MVKTANSLDGLFLLEKLSAEKKNFKTRKAIDSELTSLRALQTDTLVRLGAVSMHINNLSKEDFTKADISLRAPAPAKTKSAKRPASSFTPLTPAKPPKRAKVDALASSPAVCPAPKWVNLYKKEETSKFPNRCIYTPPKSVKIKLCIKK